LGAGSLRRCLWGEDVFAGVWKERALPADERGPVERAALARLAARRWREVVGTPQI
jgi:hypothetical protein